MQTRLKLQSSHKTTVLYYLGFICLGLVTAVLGPTLQGLAKNTNSTLAQISSLFLVNSFGYLLGSLTSGKLYDRVKGHPVLSAALLIIVVMVVLVPLAQALLLLQILFFVMGIAQGSLDVGINALIVWLHGDRVPPFMNGLHAFYGIGTTSAPLIVAAVIGQAGSLNSIYWILAILILPIGFLAPVFPSPSHALAKQQAEVRPAVPVLVWLSAVVFFAFTGAELGFAGWIYTFTTSQTYSTPSMAASINAAFWAAITIGRLIAIPLAVKLKPQKILWVNFAGTVLSLLIIIFFSSSEALLWVGTIGTGLFMASTFPTLLNDAQSRMHMSGSVTSMFFAGSSLGSMIIPWLMGQLITPLGSTAVMVAVLCSMLFTAGSYYMLNITHQSINAAQLKLVSESKK